MSWDGKRGRWAKMFRGQRFTVACSVLGVPATKEASYQAANEWWRKKRAQIEGDKPASDPIREVLADHLQRPIAEQGEWENRLADFASAIDQFQAEHRENGYSREEQTRILGKERLRQVEEDLNQRIFNEPSIPTDKTVGAYAGRWHKLQSEQVQAGTLTPDRCSNNQTCLSHFTAYARTSAPVESIDAAKVQGFYSFCLGKVAERRSDREQGWSVAYARDVFSVAKGFVRWLWEGGAIDLPKNIGSRAFKFGNALKAIRTWTPAEFNLAVEQAPGKLKLGLLLMANCGMTQQDVSDLLDTEVDWTQGRIIRRRSKTAGFENVPTVCYKLWPLTFRLLQKYRSGTERVLLTESGLPYLRKELKDNGMVSKADGFASNFVHLKKRIKLNRSLKQLRKLGASLLEGHPTYGRFGTFFLGQSPRTVKDRHYAAPSQELFDEAVAWLGQQLGQS